MVAQVEVHLSYLGGGGDMEAVGGAWSDVVTGELVEVPRAVSARLALLRCRLPAPPLFFFLFSSDLLL